MHVPKYTIGCFSNAKVDWSACSNVNEKQAGVCQQTYEWWREGEGGSHEAWLQPWYVVMNLVRGLGWMTMSNLSYTLVTIMLFKLSHTWSLISASSEKVLVCVHVYEREAIVHVTLVSCSQPLSRVWFQCNRASSLLSSVFHAYNTCTLYLCGV
jgi:hypothetical protein